MAGVTVFRGVAHGSLPLFQNSQLPVSIFISGNSTRKLKYCPKKVILVARYSQSQDAFTSRFQDRIERLPKLVEDIVQTSINTGPRGALRLAQGIQAVIGVGSEWLADASKFIASAPTVFPPEYVQEFQYCFDRVPPVPFQEIQVILREELGKPIDTVFEYVDPTPLASASIAQVHGARIRNTGEDVVIKVLKPGIEDVLVADLNFVYIVARILEFLSPDLSRASLDLDTEVIVATASEPYRNSMPVSANLLIDDRQMNALFLDVVRVSESYGLRFPREFALLMKQLLYFDRYTRLLAPNMNMLRDQRITITSNQRSRNIYQ
ncbi:hypothetical protein F511_09188 [Dorcoceras hygrometricum]|uniref:ABC1 atypical kinase-like domain-containing protein n=1 Tax=Dorcoceras hygrometricum TaxID=472368 RepID=A0A2Z7D4J6_9LAMI|nr:hypothetical protein F511_09188 [Dorcoceras hygrometricum]